MLVHAHNLGQRPAAPSYLCFLFLSLFSSLHSFLSLSPAKLLIISVSGPTRPMAPLPSRCSAIPWRNALFIIYQKQSTEHFPLCSFFLSFSVCSSPLSSSLVFASGLTSKANSWGSKRYLRSLQVPLELVTIGKRLFPPITDDGQEFYALFYYLLSRISVEWVLQLLHL